MNHIIALLFALTYATAAQAQQLIQCIPRDLAIENLTKSGKARKDTGIVSDKVVMEFWVNKETGHWAFIATGTDGFSCLHGSGTGWQEVNEPLPMVGDPA